MGAMTPTTSRARSPWAMRTIALVLARRRSRAFDGVHLSMMALASRRYSKSAVTSESSRRKDIILRVFQRTPDLFDGRHKEHRHDAELGSAHRRRRERGTGSG